MNIVFFIKYLFFFIVFVAIHYCEGLPNVGPFSVAQLWKIPLILFLLIKCLLIKKKSSIEKSSYWFVFERFFSPEILINPLFVVVQSTKQLPLALLYGYFRSYIGGKKCLETIMYSFAQYICLSSLLVLTGVITPLVEISSADSFSEGAIYYSGLFLTMHAASSYFCIAILILMNGFRINYFKTSWSKLLNLSLIFIGLYSLFLTYVRTGWLMTLVAILYLIKPSKISVKGVSKYFLGLLIVFGIVFYLYQYNDAFYARMTGKNIYTNTGGNELDLVGSGRTSFWKTGIEGWASSDLYCILFGRGNTAVVEDNYKTIGLKVFSHNQFIDTLAQNGIIAFILLIIYYLCVFRTIVTVKNSPYKKVCISIFISAIIFSFFQNEMYFNFALLFALSLILNKKYSK